MTVESVVTSAILRNEIQFACIGCSVCQETVAGLRQCLTARSEVFHEVAVVNTTLVVARCVLETECQLLALVLFPIALGMKPSICHEVTRGTEHGNGVVSCRVVHHSACQYNVALGKRTVKGTLRWGHIQTAQSAERSVHHIAHATVVCTAAVRVVHFAGNNLHRDGIWSDKGVLQCCKCNGMASQLGRIVGGQQFNLAGFVQIEAVVLDRSLRTRRSLSAPAHTCCLEVEAWVIGIEVVKGATEVHAGVCVTIESIKHTLVCNNDIVRYAFRLHLVKARCTKFIQHVLAGKLCHHRSYVSQFRKVVVERLRPFIVALICHDIVQVEISIRTIEHNRLGLRNGTLSGSVTNTCYFLTIQIHLDAGVPGAATLTVDAAWLNNNCHCDFLTLSELAFLHTMLTLVTEDACHVAFHIPSCASIRVVALHQHGIIILDVVRRKGKLNGKTAGLGIGKVEWTVIDLSCHILRNAKTILTKIPAETVTRPVHAIKRHDNAVVFNGLVGIGIGAQSEVEAKSCSVLDDNVNGTAADYNAHGVALTSHIVVGSYGMEIDYVAICASLHLVTDVIHLRGRCIECADILASCKYTNLRVTAYARTCIGSYLQHYIVI